MDTEAVSFDETMVDDETIATDWENMNLVIDDTQQGEETGMAYAGGGDGLYQWQMPDVESYENFDGTLISDQQPQMQLQPYLPVRGRRQNSKVWQYFRIEEVDNGNNKRAFCNQCNKSFTYLTGTKLAGTSHLKRHIEGICPKGSFVRVENERKPKRERSSSATDRPKTRGKGRASFVFDPERCNLDMAKMIIQHDYPLQMVEHSESLARTLNPQYTPISTSTVEDYILRIHSGGKQKLMNILAGIHGRFSLSLDLWTSDQTVGYAVLTGHFVDSEWKLQRRVLSVIALPVPDSEPALNDAVNACLKEWSINSKLLAVTLNQPVGIETTRDSLRSFLSVQKSDSQSAQFLDNGHLVTASCYARVLSSLAQDALVFARKTVEKVRSIVNCVLVSELFHEKSRDFRQHLQEECATLMYDDITNWKTTYEMLLAASKLERSISCMDYLAVDMPSVDEWIQVRTLCKYLKLFLDAASVLASNVCPTSNIFFQEVWRIHKELSEASSSNDQFLSSLTKPLKDKFEKYWDESFSILAIAAVMDPRYKLQFASMRLSMLRDKNVEKHMEVIKDKLRALFNVYVLELCTEGMHEVFYQVDAVNEGCTEYHQGVSESAPEEINQANYEIRTEYHQGVSESAPEEGNEVNHEIRSVSEGCTEYHQGVSESAPEEGNEVNHEMPADNVGFVLDDLEFGDELAYYLAEEPFESKVGERDFDVLGWWRDNKQRYPVMSRMAADILAIPFSTALPDTVFNTAGGRMDSCRSGLRPALVEALFCTKDWFKYGSLNLDSVGLATPVKMET